MKRICCVISSDSRSLLERLEGNTGGFHWIMFDCNIATEAGLNKAIDWLTEISNSVTYVLVGLTQFDQNNYEKERRLSDFLQSKKIPAQFLLHELLGIHYLQAIDLSAKTGIVDLWSCSLTGLDMLQHIVSYIQASKYETV